MLSMCSRPASLAPSLSEELVAHLYGANPWWTGNALPPLPKARRWLFPYALDRLKNGLAPVTVLRGPRQVGKTTLQEQIVEHLLSEERVEPARIFRIQFDLIPALKPLQQPILSLAYWFEKKVINKQMKLTFNESARIGKPVFLFLDEVQNLRDWAPQIKALVDQHKVRMMVTGSSALRIEQGRDSLAGRITTLELGTLLLREIAEWQGERLDPLIPNLNGWGVLADKNFWLGLREHGLAHRELRDRAFAAFAARGGYPFAQVRSDRPWEEIADHLNETVVRRVIQHDLRVGERGRKRDQSLLEAVFRLCCRYAGQAPSYATPSQELRTTLSANVGWQRLLAYLRFLNDTLLVRLVEPLEIRLKRHKSNPKIALCDHSLRAAWLQEVIPLTREALSGAAHLSDLAGHVAESIVGYFLGMLPALNLAWFPERGAEPEVDFVITVGDQRVPVEVKYRQRIDPHRDTISLRAFIEKTAYNAPFGILVTLHDEVDVADPRVVALPLSSLLLMR